MYLPQLRRAGHSLTRPGTFRGPASNPAQGGPRSHDRFVSTPGQSGIPAIRAYV